MLKWKESGGKSALLVECARCIGKSTVVKSFQVSLCFARIPFDICLLKMHINDMRSHVFGMMQAFATTSTPFSTLSTNGGGAAHLFSKRIFKIIFISSFKASVNGLALRALAHSFG